MLDLAQGFVEAPLDIAAPPAPAHLKLVPHSISNEEALLGALLIDPDQMINVGYLTPSDFYLTHHGHLFQAMVTLFEKHSRYDILTVASHLESTDHLEDIGGAGALANMINATPTSYGAVEYAAQIYKDSIRRQQIMVATEIAQAAYRDESDRTPATMVSEAVSMISSIDATRNVSSGPKSIATGVEKVLDQINQVETSGQMAGIKTGIRTLDFILGGLQSKKLYLLAGRPGMGKSALSLQIAYNVAKQGAKVLIFALEMSNEDISARLMSFVSDVPYESFKRGAGDNWQTILDAGARVAQLPIMIDDTPVLTIAAMRSIAEKEMINGKISLIIADHGGIATPAKRTGDPYRDNNQVADALMALPKQLNCPVLSLLQLSRKVENRNDKRPMMVDLRDSGKWEENADGILFLYRDEAYHPDTEFPHLGEINTAKNRGGKTGVATIYANVATNKFIDLETRTVAL